MKSQIKDIVIGIFAVIGFTAIVMGFTVQTQERPKITSIKDQNASDDSQILELKVEINKLKNEIEVLSKTDNSKSSIGKYQVSTTYRDNGNWVFETIIDTETGNIVSRQRMGGYSAY